MIEKLKQLQKEIGFPLSLKEVGTPKEEVDKYIDELVTMCFEDSSSVLGPRSASGEDFRNLYWYAYEGKDIDF